MTHSQMTTWRYQKYALAPTIVVCYDDRFYKWLFFYIINHLNYLLVNCVASGNVCGCVVRHVLFEHIRGRPCYLHIGLLVFWIIITSIGVINSTINVDNLMLNITENVWACYQLQTSRANLQFLSTLLAKGSQRYLG